MSVRSWRTFVMRWSCAAIVLAAILAPVIRDSHKEGRQGVLVAAAGTELSDEQIERQIDELVYINDDSWQGLGNDFLPAPRAQEGSAGIVEQPRPGSSSELVGPLVSAGTRAVPHLLAHLSDRRKTKVVVSHQGWFGGMFWSGEYDQGTQGGIISVVSLNSGDTFGNGAKPRPLKHVISVGDLCFAALGLIVNREFHPIQYRPTAITVINSPTITPAIAAAAIKDWSGLTPDRHRQSLVDDFRNGRESDAILRLAYYFPETAEPIALERLKRPMYSSDVIDKFVNDSLYATGDPSKWEELSADLTAKHGSAFKDGLTKRLISDCESVERGNKPDKQDPRPIFTHLFGNIDRKKWPHETSAIEQSSVTDLIEHLRPLQSAKVDDEVYRIFKAIGSGHFDAEREDGLAIACMIRLIGKGYEEEFIAYCIKRQSANVRYGDELKAIRLRLEQSRRDHPLAGAKQ